MKTKAKKEMVVIVLLVIVILAMTIGFALYSSTLTINGSVTVSPTKWSVHYVTTSYSESTGSVEATSSAVTDTDYSFTVKLDKPGDFYEATVNVTNDGSFDAVLTGITMSSLTTDQAKYLTYTVDYNGTTYSATATGLSQELAINGTVPVKVKVAYIQPSSADDLPNEAVSVTVTGSLAYSQKQ